MSPPSAGPLSRPRERQTVRRGSSPVTYPKPDAVQVIAQEFGLRFASARQFLNAADSRNPWVQAARGTAALYRAGLVPRAETLCQHIDLARAIVAPVLVTREALKSALIQEQEAEGLETAAQVAIDSLTEAEYDTWRRRALKEVGATMHAIRLGDVFFGRAPC